MSFSAGSNETFVSHAEKDYTLSILTAGGGTGVQGQLVSIADTMLAQEHHLQLQIQLF